MNQGGFAGNYEFGTKYIKISILESNERKRGSMHGTAQAQGTAAAAGAA